MEGTSARAERATPTEEATENTPRSPPPRPHRQTMIPATTGATSQAPEEDKGTATAPSPSRSPSPLQPAAELLQSGGRPPGEVGGSRGGAEGSQLEVLEWREEDVDMRRWQAWWRLEEPERRWRGLGVEDGYGRRGERKARWGLWGERVLDMGRRWCAWQRLGERERPWRGLGVGVAYGRRGEREARWGSWGEGVVDMGQRWRAWWFLG